MVVYLITRINGRTVIKASWINKKDNKKLEKNITKKLKEDIIKGDK